MLLTTGPRQRHTGINKSYLCGGSPLTQTPFLFFLKNLTFHRQQ